MQAGRRHAINNRYLMNYLRKFASSCMFAFSFCVTLTLLVTIIQFHSNIVSNPPKTTDNWLGSLLIDEPFHNHETKHDKIKNVNTEQYSRSSNSINTNVNNNNKKVLPKNLTAAICHPVLHNKPDLKKVLLWTNYHYNLGFDHIFMFYQKEIAKLDYFSDIDKLPYVTLTQFKPTASQIERDKIGKVYEYYGQQASEEQCMGDLAKDFDWTLVIDADEFLWFSEHLNVKQFLVQYHNEYQYLSFGKWMYTVMHKTNAYEDDDKLFGLSTYPYTAKSYCFHQDNDLYDSDTTKKSTSYSYCPGWKGRCKIMAKPKHYKHGIKTHGFEHEILQKHALHFDTSAAHIKEWVFLLNWRFLLQDQNWPTPKLHSENDKKDFHVLLTNGGEVRLHAFEQGYPIRNDDKGSKSVRMSFDTKLNEWLKFVSSLKR